MQRSQISVPVDTDTFVALVHFLEGHSSWRDPVEVVGEAINYWIDNAEWKPEFLDKREQINGYRWKALLLPDGTKIRMKYEQEYHYAEVVGDAFLWNGKPSSPSQFAGGVTNTARNAWRDLEIQRPGERGWNIADDLRKVKR